MYRSQAMLRTSACEQLSPKHKGHLTIKRRLSTSGKENRHLRTSLVCPWDHQLELKIRHNTFSRRGIICSILKLNRSAPDFGLQGQPIFSLGDSNNPVSLSNHPVSCDSRANSVLSLTQTAPLSSLRSSIHKHWHKEHWIEIFSSSSQLVTNTLALC